MQAPTTLTPLAVETAPLETVAFDLYRDIHKGIRNGLFGVTLAAGSVDPGDRDGVTGIATRWLDLVGMLITHAEHEDEFVQPLIRGRPRHSPRSSSASTPRSKARWPSSRSSPTARSTRRRVDRRLAVHRLYLGLASFTSDYLQHQAFEELEVGPALASAYSARRAARHRPVHRRQHPARRHGRCADAHAAGDERRRPHGAPRRHAGRRAPKCSTASSGWPSRCSLRTVPRRRGRASACNRTGQGPGSSPISLSAVASAARSFRGGLGREVADESGTLLADLFDRELDAQVFALRAVVHRNHDPTDRYPLGVVGGMVVGAVVGELLHANSVLNVPSNRARSALTWRSCTSELEMVIGMTHEPWIWPVTRKAAAATPA